MQNTTATGTSTDEVGLTSGATVETNAARADVSENSPLETE
jgi:hypothetical protein